MQEKLITVEIDEAGDLRSFTRTEYKASVLDLFFGPLGPYMFGVMPPRNLLNDFFRLGSIDGKHNGKHVLFEWKPFELSEDDYSYLAGRLPSLIFQATLRRERISSTGSSFDPSTG